MMCSSRNALTGCATAAAILAVCASALSLIWEKEADFTNRCGSGIASRNLETFVGEGVTERVRGLGREESVRAEVPLFAQLLTKRKLQQES